MAFLLLLRRDIPPGAKIAKNIKIVSVQERLRLRPEQITVCYVDVAPLLSAVEMRAIRHCSGLK